MTKLTLEEAMEIILIERFAEKKFAELSKDWNDEKRELIYDMIKKDFEPMDVLGFHWGMHLEDELKQLIENYAVERDAYIARKIEEVRQEGHLG